jgi:hypothetical protein
MNDTIQIAELEGLIAPDPVGFWPPAPAWYLLGVVLLGCLVAGIIVGLLRYRRSKYRREALRRLHSLMQGSAQPVAGDLRKLNILLKSVALRSYARQDVAGLEGEAWTHFLNETAGRFSLKGNEEVLLHSGRLSLPPEEKIDSEAWMDLCRFTGHWIKKH